MDVAPDIDSLELSIRTALKSKRGVRVNRKKDCVRILSDDADQLISWADVYNGRPRLSTERWHGHYESAEDLAWSLLMILGGYSRQVEEFKGTELSATLLMNYDGQAWFITNVAFYLNPYIESRWTLNEQEAWEWNFITWKLVDASQEFRKRYSNSHLDARGLPPHLLLGEHRIIKDAAYIFQGDDCFMWYQNRFGKPLPDMRWAMNYSEQFIYQVPTAWTELTFEPEDFKDGYEASPGGARIIIQTRFLDLAGREAGSKGAGVVRYDELKLYERDEETDGAVWAESTWVMHFQSGEEQMTAWYSLFWPGATSADANVLLMKATIDQMLKMAVFAPSLDIPRLN